MADDKKIIFSMVGVSKTYPPQKQVLKNIYLSFFYGAKIGIIGLNGSGKSSLLKIIAGVDKEYQGEVVFAPGYSVGYLEQEPHLEPGKTVIEVVREGVKPVMDLLAEFEKVNEAFGDPDVLENPDRMDALIARQAELQDALDAADAWNIDNRLERAMDALQCPPDDQVVDTLSGGERRRADEDAGTSAPPQNGEKSLPRREAHCRDKQDQPQALQYLGQLRPEVSKDKPREENPGDAEIHPANPNPP